MRYLTTSIMLLMLFLSITDRVFAGPPLIINDPGTPGDGKYEINIAASMEKTEAETKIEAPILDLNYGLGDDVQLKFEIPWVFLHEEEGSAKNGVGKISSGIKWRFLDEKADGFDVSIYPQIEFDTPGSSSDDRGLVDEGTKLVIPFQAGKKFGRVGLNAELGYALTEHKEDEWIYGLALSHEISGRFKLAGELAGNALGDFGEHEILINVGAIWKICNHMALSASIGRSIHHSEGDGAEFLSYVGVQFLY